jgi:Flp pilus assembly protein TadG
MRYGRLGQPHSASDGKGARRRRRGAVLVITATAMAGLMLLTAFAVDLSRLYVLRTELQTAADAAALAAALRLNEDYERAVSSALSAVKANPALGGAADVDAVRIGTWDPDDRTFHAGAKLDTADAAQVTVGRTTTYLFGRFVSDGPIRITARATAWAGAPAARTDCMKPWFILHQDFMAAIGGPHENLTNDDVRRLRDTVSRKVRMTLRLKHGVNPKPLAGAGFFYGMELPTPYSGESPPNGTKFRDNVTGCNTMEQGWVTRTEDGKTAASESWPGLKGLCHPLGSDGKCYNAKGGVGVPITVSIFCTGPEHTSGTMWFQTEWMTGFMIEGGAKDGADFILKGYLIPTQGTGEIRDPRKATGLLRTILVQ